MNNTPQTVDRLWDRGVSCPFDEVIDVRSPGEFAEDHIVGAINLPVLSDAERVEVGTINRQVNAFAARKVGAAIVSLNIGRHLQAHFADKAKDYRPLVYCWRGGQRSASIATVLSQIGWRVTVLQGGYKTYRAHVQRELESLPSQFRYQIIAGATGTGKTQVLHALAARGAQVLDLEGLANHRGSILGNRGPQPSQKYFETQLFATLEGFDSIKPVWVESESNRIGNLYLPVGLWKSMQAATGTRIRMPLAGRVQHLLAEYTHFVAGGTLLKQKLRQLTTRVGPRQVLRWEAQIDAGEWEPFVASLLEVHYDPGYATSTKRCFPNVTRTVEMADTSVAAIGEMVDALMNGQDL